MKNNYSKDYSNSYVEQEFPLYIPKELSSIVFYEDVSVLAKIAQITKNNGYCYVSNDFLKYITNESLDKDIEKMLKEFEKQLLIEIYINEDRTKRAILISDKVYKIFKDANIVVHTPCVPDGFNKISNYQKREYDGLLVPKEIKPIIKYDSWFIVAQIVKLVLNEGYSSEYKNIINYINGLDNEKMRDYFRYLSDRNVVNFYIKYKNDGSGVESSIVTLSNKTYSIYKKHYLRLHEPCVPAGYLEYNPNHSDVVNDNLFNYDVDLSKYGDSIIPEKIKNKINYDYWPLISQLAFFCSKRGRCNSFIRRMEKALHGISKEYLNSMLVDLSNNGMIVYYKKYFNNTGETRLSIVVTLSEFTDVAYSEYVNMTSPTVSDGYVPFIPEKGWDFNEESK